MSKINIEYEKVFCNPYYDCAYISLEGYEDFQLTVILDLIGLKLGLHFQNTPATGEYSGSLSTPWFEGKGGWNKPIKTEFAVSNDSIFLDLHVNNLKQYSLTELDFIELIEAAGTAARFLYTEREKKLL